MKRKKLTKKKLLFWEIIITVIAIGVFLVSFSFLFSGHEPIAERSILAALFVVITVFVFASAMLIFTNGGVDAVAANIAAGVAIIAAFFDIIVVVFSTYFIIIIIIFCFGIITGVFKFPFVSDNQLREELKGSSLIKYLIPEVVIIFGFMVTNFLLV